MTKFIDVALISFLYVFAVSYFMFGGFFLFVEEAPWYIGTGTIAFGVYMIGAALFCLNEVFWDAFLERTP